MQTQAPWRAHLQADELHELQRLEEDRDVYKAWVKTRSERIERLRNTAIQRLRKATA